MELSRTQLEMLVESPEEAGVGGKALSHQYKWQLLSQEWMWFVQKACRTERGQHWPPLRHCQVLTKVLVATLKQCGPDQTTSPL